MFMEPAPISHCGPDDFTLTTPAHKPRAGVATPDGSFQDLAERRVC
jgi:hypothetical protein